MSIILIHLQISLMKESRGLKAIFAAVLVLKISKTFMNGVHSSRTLLLRDEPFPTNIWKHCYFCTKIISPPQRTKVTIVLYDLSGVVYSLSVGVCCSKEQKAMLLFQTHHMCKISGHRESIISPFTYHIHSKIFSIAISITSPCSKVHNSAVKVHARLKFVLWGLRNPRAILFFTIGSLLCCRRQRGWLLHQENTQRT